MSGYQLKYFDLRGRGELTRLMFMLTGQIYEDQRVAFDQWPAEQKKTPFGWLPTLTFDGKTYSESMAIAKYVAREGGYGGKTSLEYLEIDQVTGIVVDIMDTLAKYTFEADQTRKEQLKNTAITETLPKYLKALDKILTTSGSGFYVGKQLTVADVAVFDVLCDRVSDELLSKYPQVVANMNKVTSHDKLKTYLENRGPAMF